MKQFAVGDVRDTGYLPRELGYESWNVEASIPGCVEYRTGVAGFVRGTEFGSEIR